MTARAPLGPLLRAFFADHLVQQKAASPQTIHAYRDAFRLLLTFLDQHRQRKPEALTLDDLDAPVIGRRDYAVLLLATRYGLRPCDLRQLRLEAVDWREGVLSITQAKTGRVLTLPLLADVADALIAYLRNGRPATPSRYVFVRHKAPFEPFVAANNLATIMRQALQRVGLDQREGRRGLYLLRHTLASRMLASGSPLKHVGDVLGHASTDTTMEYASVDLTALRRVAISEAEVRP